MANDPGPDLGPCAGPAEAIAQMARTVASVADIPWDELPDGPARGCLLEMAYAGGDVGAFRAADGGWRVRLWSQAVPCAAWAAMFCV